MLLFRKNTLCIQKILFFFLNPPWSRKSPHSLNFCFVICWIPDLGWGQIITFKTLLPHCWTGVTKEGCVKIPWDNMYKLAQNPTHSRFPKRLKSILILLCPSCLDRLRSYFLWVFTLLLRKSPYPLTLSFQVPFLSFWGRKNKGVHSILDLGDSMGEK